MNYRAIVLVATVVVVAGMGWRLMANAGERSNPISGPTIDVPAPSAEPQRPASSGIDCTRGVACPIIYAPPKGR